MKSLALMLVLAVAACSESETPLPIENPMAVPSALPHGVQYAIPEGIHPNLAAYFDDLQPICLSANGNSYSNRCTTVAMDGRFHLESDYDTTFRNAHFSMYLLPMV